MIELFLALNEFNAHTKVHLASTPTSKSTNDQDKKVTTYERYTVIFLCV